MPRAAATIQRSPDKQSLILDQSFISKPNELRKSTIYQKDYLRIGSSRMWLRDVAPPPEKGMSCAVTIVLKSQLSIPKSRLACRILAS